jgi:hypothetical protein
MKRANAPPPPAIVVRPHPPERLVRAAARGEVLSAGFCCSCCCCLHSLGSLAGAVAGSFYPPDPPAAMGKAPPPAGLCDDELDRPADTMPARPRPVASRIFWWSTVALSVPWVLFWCLLTIHDDAVFRVLITFGVWPVALPCASVVSAIVLAARPSVRRDTREWKRLGWITLGTVAGALIGWSLMMPFFRN